MKTCATCKHWDQEGAALGRDLAATGMSVNFAYECRLIGMMTSRDQEGQRFPAAVRSLEGYLMTSPDFGCVLHEEKP